MNYSKALFIASLLAISSQAGAMEPKTYVQETIEIEQPMSGEDTDPMFYALDAPGSSEDTNFPTRRTRDTGEIQKSGLQPRRIQYSPEKQKEKESFFSRKRK